MFTKKGIENITPGMSLFTVKLIERLKDGIPGDEIDDDELRKTAEVGCQPNQQGYAFLMSAIRYCRRHHGVNWKRIPKGNVIRCLKANETVEEVGRTRKAIFRKSGVALAMLKNVNGADMDDATRSQFNLQTAQLGGLRVFASQDMTKRMEQKQIEAGHKPDMNKMLEAFK